MRGLVLGICTAWALAGGAWAQGGRVDLMRLHDALHLTADQESGWRDYTASLAPDPQSEQRRQAADQLLPSLATPRRIALLHAMMQEDAADLDRKGAAVVGFYTRLTPDQQRLFDRQTLPANVAADPRPCGRIGWR